MFTLANSRMAYKPGRGWNQCFLSPFSRTNGAHCSSRSHPHHSDSWLQNRGREAAGRELSLSNIRDLFNKRKQGCDSAPWAEEPVSGAESVNTEISTRPTAQPDCLRIDSHIQRSILTLVCANLGQIVLLWFWCRHSVLFDCGLVIGEISCFWPRCKWWQSERGKMCPSCSHKHTWLSREEVNGEDGRRQHWSHSCSLARLNWHFAHNINVVHLLLKPSLNGRLWWRFLIHEPVLQSPRDKEFWLILADSGQRTKHSSILLTCTAAQIAAKPRRQLQEGEMVQWMFWLTGW